MGNPELINGSAAVAVGDLESLLRCAPRCRAVIVCGGLAGLSAQSLERLVRQRAPQARLVRADRMVTAQHHRNGRLRRLVRPTAVAR